MQSVLRGDVPLYLPMLQSLQSETSEPEAPLMYFPATQLVQSVNAVEPAAVYVPAAHNLQFPEFN
tara:strand:- start:438 stop:632 length:195 start_codon:yes stop_codon:yes gene_type:complete